MTNNTTPPLLELLLDLHALAHGDASLSVWRDFFAAAWMLPLTAAVAAAANGPGAVLLAVIVLHALDSR